MYLTEYLATSELLLEQVEPFKPNNPDPKPTPSMKKPIPGQQPGTGIGSMPGQQPEQTLPTDPQLNDPLSVDPMANNDPDSVDDFTSPSVEFEPIKKYVLFGRLKEIKRKLDFLEINRQDPNIVGLFEFVNLIILFFNTFNYVEAVGLIDTLVKRIDKTLNMKIDKPSKE